MSYNHAYGRVYGLGQHKTNRTAYDDYAHLFEHSQVYAYSAGGDITIPFYLSTAAFAFLYNEPGYGFVYVNRTHATWMSNATHQLDYWLSSSPAHYDSVTPYPALSGNFADATGHPNPLPHFASGFWQSKDRYRNQSEVLDVAAHFHALHVPVQVLVIDWYHWHFLGDWSFWLPLCWPDPTAMVRQLSSYGMHTMITVWPRVDPQSSHYADMSRLKYLTTTADDSELVSSDGSSLIYDAFNPDARAYVWKAIVSGYVRYGLQLFWLDEAEPDASQSGLQWWGGKSDLEVGMAWTIQHLRMIHDGSLSSSVPQSELIILTRHA